MEKELRRFHQLKSTKLRLNDYLDLWDEKLGKNELEREHQEEITTSIQKKKKEKAHSFP